MSQFVYVNQTLATFELASPTVASTAMTASLISTPFNINNSQTFAMQFIWTGTPTGTLEIMGSLDGINYNVALGSHAISGAAGTYTLDLSATAGLITTCGSVQGQYIFTSGSGTLTTVTGASKYPLSY